MNKMINKVIKKLFSKKYNGVEGDVNWKNGKSIDARKHVFRDNRKMPPKSELNITTNTDYSDLLTEARKDQYVTYRKTKEMKEIKLDDKENKEKKNK